MGPLNTMGDKYRLYSDWFIPSSISVLLIRQDNMIMVYADVELTQND